MSKWSQNQPDFGSTKPKRATLKKTVKLLIFQNKVMF